LKAWHRFALAVLLGLATGVTFAVVQIRAGLGAGQIANGPWSTAKTFGTKDASALVRAQVALSGLLALPAKEAMYFTARIDSRGRPLEGRCSYMVRGNALDARWWSLTLYRGKGWLVPNAQNRWSFGSAALPRDGWAVVVSPDPVGGNWLPTGGAERFDLTLRAYHPGDALLGAPESAALPTIERWKCR
jgi:hypothetical protein